jgi:hypothetical protein
MHRAASVSNNNDFADDRGNCRIKLGIEAISELPFPFSRASGESPSQSKAGSGRSGVIRAIVVPTAAAR